MRDVRQVDALILDMLDPVWPLSEQVVLRALPDRDDVVVVRARLSLLESRGVVVRAGDGRLLLGGG